MRTASRHLTTACAIVLLGMPSLAGCTPERPPLPSPTAAATDAPVFASDEEALAAAKKAYAAYLVASEAASTGLSSSRDAFLALSTGTAHEEDISAARLFDGHGWHKVGKTSFDSMQLQDSGWNYVGSWEIRTYLCVDVSESDVVDAEGKSVAKADRPLRLPLEVAFTTGSNSHLLISESRVWSGADFC